MYMFINTRRTLNVFYRYYRITNCLTFLKIRKRRYELINLNTHIHKKNNISKVTTLEKVDTINPSFGKYHSYFKYIYIYNIYRIRISNIYIIYRIRQNNFTTQKWLFYRAENFDFDIRI